MRRKALIWTAAALIIAGAAAYFLWPSHGDRNPDFGNADTVLIVNEGLPITCSGDTDIVDITHVAPSGRSLEVFFSGERDLACTAGYFVDGELISGKAEGLLIERREKGGWVPLSEHIVDYVKAFLPSIKDYRPYNILYFTPDSIFYPPKTDLTFPYYQEPGEYRLTLYFHDNVDDGLSKFTTGEEQYEISFIITVPEVSGKPFDILSMYIDDEDGEYHLRGEVRRNFDGPLYMDRTCGTLEKKVGREWVEVPPPEGRDAPMDIASEDQPNGYKYTGSSYYPKGMIMSFFRYLYIDDPDPNTEYRLTLTFREDGNGKLGEYKLYIRFKFE